MFKCNPTKQSSHHSILPENKGYESAAVLASPHKDSMSYASEHNAHKIEELGTEDLSKNENKILVLTDSDESEEEEEESEDESFITLTKPKEPTGDPKPLEEEKRRHTLSEEGEEEPGDMVGPLPSEIKKFISQDSPIYKHLLISHKDSFKDFEPLGKGGFGSVVKARHILDNNVYAIKKIKLHLGVDQDIKNHKVFREVQMMTIVNNANVSYD